MSTSYEAAIFLASVYWELRKGFDEKNKLHNILKPLRSMLSYWKIIQKLFDTSSIKHAD